MDLFDVVLSQRACRHFSGEDVPDEDIERMLTAATHAPSAENSQPWVFVVVRDAQARGAIGRLAGSLWSSGARGYVREHLDRRTLDSLDASIEENFGRAPVLVVVAVDHRSGVHQRAIASSIFPAVQNLLLAAVALGYGSALTTLATNDEVATELRAIVGLPAEVEALAVVPIGRSCGPLGPPRREPFTTKTHRDVYGTAW